MKTDSLVRMILSLSSVLPLPDLLARIAGILLETTGADRALVLLPDKGRWRVEAVGEGPDPGIRTGLHLPAEGESLLYREALDSALRSGRTWTLPDPSRGNGLPEDPGLRGRGVRSLFCQPVRSGDRAVLAVYLESRKDSKAFRDYAEGLPEPLSAQIAASLENSLRFERLRTEADETELLARQFRAAAEGTSDGAWDWDLLSDRVYFTDQYYRMLGYEPGDFPASYESWQKLLHPEDSERAVKLLRSLVREGIPYETEHRLKAKNGEWRWVLGRGKVTGRDGTGKVVRISGANTDITKRIQTENALEKRLLSMSRPAKDAGDFVFEDMFDLEDVQRLQDQFTRTCGVAALVTRPDGTPITRPSGFTELCGNIIRKTPLGLENCIKSDTIIGQFNAEGPIIHPCLSAGLCNAGASITVGGRHVANWLIGQVRSEEQNEEEIVEYARKIGADREAFRTAYRKVPVMPKEQFDRAAELLYIVANQISSIAYQNLQQSRFILELKKAQEEIRRLNEGLEQEVARQTEELRRTNLELGDSNIELSRTLDELKSAQGRIVVSEKLAALGRLAAGIAHEINTPLAAITASNRVVLRFAHTELDGLAAVLSRLDPEARALLKEARERCFHGPPGFLTDIPGDERSSRRRTADILAKAGLPDARSLAEELIEGGIADLTERALPILSGGGAPDFLRALREIVGVQRAGKISEEAADRISRVVSAMRVYMGGAKTEEAASLSLSEELAGTLDLYHHKIRNRIEVDLDVPGDIAVHGRRQELARVWFNLLSNAIDALGGSGRIEIRAKKTGPDVLVSFVDSGTGIPEELQPRIFEPFFTTKSSGEGTGLGLDMARRFARNNGGDISFNSRPGRTEFTVRLPGAKP